MNLASRIIADLLISARAAAQNIQTDAKERSFEGDVADAPAVLRHLADCDLDGEDYALLYANSAIIETCCRTVLDFGTEADKTEAMRWEAFDYVNN